MYIAENLKRLRKSRDLTQEDAAEILGVSAQSISKWERGDTCPDISMLPSLANMYKISVDELIGMDKINEAEARGKIFTNAHELLQKGECKAAVRVYADALKTFPNDEGIMSDMAMILSLDGNDGDLKQALKLCERVLEGNPAEKIRHTTRAALSFIYYKNNEKEKSLAAAQNLPHIRESREKVMGFLKSEPAADEVDAYIKFLILGEEDIQEIILITFGTDMIPMCEEHDLLNKIGVLRNELINNRKKGRFELPIIRIRDETELPPKRVRLRLYTDVLLDKDFDSAADATDEILQVLRKISAND